MKLSYIISIVTLPLALTLTQISLAKTTRPTTCPSVDLIRNVGVNEFRKGPSGWIGVAYNEYNTGEEWTFGLFLGAVNSEEDAAANAKKALSSLTFVKGPTYNEWLGVSRCDYETELGESIAVNPPLDIGPKINNK